MSSIVHHGPFDESCLQNPTLNFIYKYSKIIDSLDLSTTPASAFFAPFAAYHDTKGDVHITASHIWQWLARSFAPFAQIRHDVVEVRVVSEDDGRDVVYCECLTHFRLHGDEHEIVVPRFFIWTVGDAVPGEGTDGKQIQDVRLFWDTGVIGRYITELKKRGKGL